ncbi:MAG: hypothetical protein JWN34_3880 [Bryobacterales bacterium]|nr:hypothetical protein [Bryobacterales bacterium]
MGNNGLQRGSARIQHEFVPGAVACFMVETQVKPFDQQVLQHSLRSLLRCGRRHRGHDFVKRNRRVAKPFRALNLIGRCAECRSDQKRHVHAQMEPAGRIAAGTAGKDRDSGNVGTEQFHRGDIEVCSFRHAGSMYEEASQQEGERADDSSPVSHDTMTRGGMDLLMPPQSRSRELFFWPLIGACFQGLAAVARSKQPRSRRASSSASGRC